MKNKKIVVLIQYITFFGIALGLIYWQYTKLTPQDIVELKLSLYQLKDRWWIAFPIIIIGFFSHFVRALRWRILLEPLNIKPSVVNVSGAVFIGYLTNLLIPRMGEVAKCTVLAKYDDQPADKIIGTIVAERGFDLVCLALISILTFLVQVDLVSEYVAIIFKDLDTSKLLWSLGIAAIFILFLVFIAKFLLKKNRTNKIGQFINGLSQGLSSIFKMKKIGWFILYTILLWGSYLSLIYIGFFSMVSTEHLGWGAALSLLVFGSLGMIVTPGGLGAYPQAIQMVLAMICFWLDFMARTNYYHYHFRNFSIYYSSHLQ
jgi:uncharacterized protein (TIRG00374 family)